MYTQPRLDKHPRRLCRSRLQLSPAKRASFVQNCKLERCDSSVKFMSVRVVMGQGLEGLKVTETRQASVVVCQK